MADTEQTTRTAVEVSVCDAKVSSFAIFIRDLFKNITPTVNYTGKDAEKDQASEKEFKDIFDKLKRIYEQNKETQKLSKIIGANQAYRKYEDAIKSQYNAYETMVERVKEDSASNVPQVEEFKQKYKMLEEALGLKVFYWGVTNKSMVFRVPLLEVYLLECNKDKKLMKHKCDKLTELFSMGLQSLMAYTYVTGGNENEIREKWASNVKEICAAMERALSQCE